jgi:SSS family transporter
MPAHFATIDWIVLIAYLAVVVGLGVVVSRRSPRGDDFFLAGRRMPMWAVAVSMLATSLSAATFIGGPEQAYATDLTYLSANIGGLIAVLVVAVVFVPAFYRHQVTSIYELLGHAYGPSVRGAASAMFMLGRVLASGARLFMVALPFSLVAFDSLQPTDLLWSIAIIACTATAYTVTGGIRAVIWTDVLQAVVLVSTVGLAVALLWSKIPADAGAIVEGLRTSPDGDKLRVIDLGLDPSKNFTLWTAVIGFTLFNVAAFGTDQDLAQRLLTCRSARSGAWSVVISNLIGWPVVFLFLAMGLLLYVHYDLPELAGAAAAPAGDGDRRQVFLTFILTELPAGVRGLMMAGLFAAAMSSMDSALNALASTTIADFYRPWRRRRTGEETIGDRREIRASRAGIVGWGLALALVAGGCVYWQQASGETLIAFALGVMVFAYGGLLGVFLTALLTSRGNAASALGALAAGLVTAAVLDPTIGVDAGVAIPWRMVAATVVSFGFCVIGSRGRMPPGR